MPTQLPRGEYKIRIEGDVGEGRGGSIFASETRLKFSEKFLSILIQTNRHIYNGGQKSELMILTYLILTIYAQVKVWSSCLSLQLSTLIHVLPIT